MGSVLDLEEKPSVIDKRRKYDPINFVVLLLLGVVTLGIYPLYLFFKVSALYEELAEVETVFRKQFWAYAGILGCAQWSGNIQVAGFYVADFAGIGAGIAGFLLLRTVLRVREDALVLLGLRDIFYRGPRFHLALWVGGYAILYGAPLLAVQIGGPESEALSLVGGVLIAFQGMTYFMDFNRMIPHVRKVLEAELAFSR